MFRRIVSSVSRLRPAISRKWHFGILPRYGEESPLTDLECIYENYLNRPEIDSWQLRKALCELHAMDMIPSPPVVIAGLRACRRINDYALAMRMLEALKFKCGPHLGKIWPYMLQEIRPTLEELGVETPEQIGYDKPELWFEDPHWE